MNADHEIESAQHIQCGSGNADILCVLHQHDYHHFSNLVSRFSWNSSDYHHGSHGLSDNLLGSCPSSALEIS